LATRFPHQHVTANELPSVIERTFAELKQGKDDAGRPIDHPAVQGIQLDEASIRRDIPKIVETCFSQKFAAEFAKIIESVPVVTQYSVRAAR
jgi:hypothetical protein